MNRDDDRGWLVGELVNTLPLVRYLTTARTPQALSVNISNSTLK